MSWLSYLSWALWLIGAVLAFVVGAIAATRRAWADEEKRWQQMARALEARDRELLALRQQWTDVGFELARLRRKARAIDELEHERFVLQQRLSIAEGRSRRDAVLEQELRSLRAQSYAGAPPPRPLEIDRDQNGSAPFERIVQRVAAKAGTRSVALADGQSFSVAGWGEHQEALSAWSGALIESATRGQTLVPMGRVCRIVVETDTGAVIALLPIVIDDVPLALATLGIGSAPEVDDLRNIVGEMGLARAKLRPRLGVINAKYIYK